MKDAPEYGVDHDSKVCDFIDQYVSCKVPKEDCKLKELVLLLQQLQQHKHSSYCKRNLFFPKPPSYKTLITKDDTDPDDIEQALTVLGKVQKLIAEGKHKYEP